jgi:3-methyl-2-oxobutanoate hydroxymethyltransferase
MSEQQKSGEVAAPYGTGAGQPDSPAAAPIKRIRTHHLAEMKQRGEKITMLTAYDMYTAQTFDEAGIDMLLIGDSASNNVLRQRDLAPDHSRRAPPLHPRRGEVREARDGRR